MRLRYIDYTKGFAIILMLFGHTMIEINFVHLWIYSFHMPLFFIVDGILIAERAHNSGESCENIVFKRWKSVGIPYFCFGIMLAVFYALLNIVANESLSLGYNMWKLLTFQGIDSLWFLPVYAFADIIMKAVERFEKEEKYIRLAIAILSIIILSTFHVENISRYEDLFCKTLLGICFIEIGFLISQFSLNKINSVIISSVLLALGFILAFFNGPVEMAAFNIGNPMIYFISATATSVAVLNIFRKLEDKQWRLIEIIETFGKNSIVLVCTNNLLIESIRLLDYKLTGNVLCSLKNIGSIIFTVILLLLEWQIIILANGCLAPLFGREKVK